MPAVSKNDRAIPIAAAASCLPGRRGTADLYRKDSAEWNDDSVEPQAKSISIWKAKSAVVNYRHSPERFRSAGHVLIDRISDLLATLSERKVTAGSSVSEIRDLIDATAGMPDDGSGFEPQLSHIIQLLTRYSL